MTTLHYFVLNFDELELTYSILTTWWDFLSYPLDRLLLNVFLTCAHLQFSR